jgi:hypothetical protein
MNARPTQRGERVRRLLADLGFTGPGMAGWREQGACLGTDPELFYPVGEGVAVAQQTEQARHVCTGCLVRAECLADVMATEDPALRWGVTGGLSPAERAELFTQTRRAVA